MHPFKVSDKVVCVNATGFTWNPVLVRDRIYVIAAIQRGKSGNDAPGVKLVGVQGFIATDGWEIGYLASRFRKLTDIQNENKLKEYGMLPNELVSLGITERAQRAFLAQTLSVMPSTKSTGAKE